MEAWDRNSSMPVAALRGTNYLGITIQGGWLVQMPICILMPSSKRIILEWIANANRPETSEKRITTTVSMAATNLLTSKSLPATCAIEIDEYRTMDPLWPLRPWLDPSHFSLVFYKHLLALAGGLMAPPHQCRRGSPSSVDAPLHPSLEPSAALPS